MNKLIVILALVLLQATAYAQLKISGFVKDAETGEMLIGANLREEGSGNGTTTNNNGYFALLGTGKPIQVSFMGYKKQVFSCKADTLLTILLEPGQELGEVKVMADRSKRFNVATLSIEQLKSIPSIGGKPDVMKTLQLMPGIQAQAEGTSLLNVRGGNPGENLYLIDNIPLLYVNHLGGFLSVFNPDMINGMEVYKGGFPAKYGGKLSSVMAITQREGNNNEWKGNLGIGITDASFSVEGPLFNKKASIIVTGRKTLIDYPMILLSRISDQGVDISYGFHDINAKLTHRPNTRNSYHFNIYQGDDYVNYQSIDVDKTTNQHNKIENRWGSLMLSGRWNRVVAPRLFANNVVSMTNYRLKMNGKFVLQDLVDSTKTESKLKAMSRVNDLSFRSDWQYKVTMDYDIEFGAKLTALTYMPNSFVLTNTKEMPTEIIHSYENAAYANNRIRLLNFLDADLGLRAVNFSNKGYTKTFFEPRVNISTNITSTQALNFSYQQVSQFAHLLFTSGTILNNEIWVPADKQLDPSTSVQYSAGWKGSFKKGEYNAEISVYHKELYGLATYKEGYSNLIGDGSWRNKLETGGIGKSEGIEFLLRKDQGSWTGFIAYTYSKTTRQYKGINRGLEYTFEFDRPHVAAINFSKKLSKKWLASATWVYQTGLPYTPVIGRQYVLDDYGVYKEGLIYGSRNSDRMQDYHRLDLGFTYSKTTKRGLKAEWNFSAYNAYNRHNASAYYYSGHIRDFTNYDFNGNYLPFKKYKFSFFPIIPSVSYKVYFDKRPSTK